MPKPFQYHYQLKDYFKKQEKTWKWFSEVKVMKEQTEKLKSELLKNTYRMDPETEPSVYSALHTAKEKLGIVIPITIYQSQVSEQKNAGIMVIENEAHLVLSGPIIKLLNETELLVLIAHELSHVLLDYSDNREFEITDRIITSIANDYQSDDSYLETARLFKLFTELFCDFGAYEVTENVEAVISTLVKINTGLDKISTKKYLEQADEILSKSGDGSQHGETHPESYIRAKCVQLFSEKRNEAYPEIEKLIIGKPGLYSLSLFSKSQIYEITRELIQIITKPKWMQSELIMAHYRQYFQDFKINSQIMITPELKNHLNEIQDSLKEYYAYVMLDFAFCDRDIAEPAAGLILDLSEQLGIEQSLKKVIKKEFKFSDKRFTEFASNASTALNNILESEQEKTY